MHAPPVAFDPGAQQMGRRPGGFHRAELAQHRAGGVIYHVHETAVGGAIFQPGMKAGIQLHQFAEMRLAHPALAIRLSRSLAAPKSGRFHPAPQGLGGTLGVRLLPPSVPPPASVRSPHNACAPERAPLGETPRGELGWRLARSCHAAALSHPHRDSAPTPAWLADSSALATPPPLAAASCPPLPAP